MADCPMKIECRAARGNAISGWDGREAQRMGMYNSVSESGWSGARKR